MELGIVGATGLVGAALIKEILTYIKADFTLHLFGPSVNDLARIETGGKPVTVHRMEALTSCNCDVVLFATPAEISKQWIPLLLKWNRQTIVIDGSSVYRNDPDVPLVIPEINIESIKKHKRIIASPNCTTTLALMVLAPLHKALALESFELCSYQAASGAGKKGLQELEQQCHAWEKKEPLKASVFPRKLLFNAIPQIGTLDTTGCSEEEQKIVFESRKILNLPYLPVFATCVRIPVRTCHSLAITASFRSKFSLEIVKQILREAPGVKVYEDSYPDVSDAFDNQLCHVGRLRINPVHENTLSFWVVGNQILKGSATNMRQILEQFVF